MKNNVIRHFPMIFGRILRALFVLFLIFSFAAASRPRNVSTWFFQAGGEAASLVESVQDAKAKLQAGINTWDLELLKTARDRFINCLMKAKSENAFILYHIALADYRLITFYLSSKANEDAEKSLAEAQKYLEKATTVDPSFGEADALYGYLLGFEIALHPEKAMSLGMSSFGYFSKSFEKDPENPRIHLLKGISLFYTPEAYGGGADNVLGSLSKAVGLFEKEVVKDPLKPSWGKEEAYTYLGLAYKQKKDYGKAREMLKRALEVNPEFGLAKKELSGLDKN
jgi:tetratricopeptide (TPR) repeat protein